MWGGGLLQQIGGKVKNVITRTWLWLWWFRRVVVSIVIGCGQDDRRLDFRQAATDVFLVQGALTVVGVHPVSCVNVAIQRYGKKCDAMLCP
jgi:hypothetical protein